MSLYRKSISIFICAQVFALALPQPAQAHDPVLDPNKYFGKAKIGYMAAQACPEICEKLFCYCGCDVTDEHDSLLDCFTTDHGVDCYICQEEAVIALKMKKEGKSLGEIQKAIDAKFEKMNPFDPTDKLKKYWSIRSYKPGSQDGASSAKSAKSSGAALSSGKNSTANPGKNAQPKSSGKSCCGGKDKRK